MRSYLFLIADPVLLAARLFVWKHSDRVAVKLIQRDDDGFELRGVRGLEPGHLV